VGTFSDELVKELAGDDDINWNNIFKKAGKEASGSGMSKGVAEALFKGMEADLEKLGSELVSRRDRLILQGGKMSMDKLKDEAKGLLKDFSDKILGNESQAEP
jgi:hypothetical protein